MLGSKSLNINLNINDFHILNYKYKKNTTVERQLFVRRIEGSLLSDEISVGSRLLIINLPPFADADKLSKMFKKQFKCDIEQILLSNDLNFSKVNSDKWSKFYLPKQYPFFPRVALIKFTENEVIEKILSFEKQLLYLSGGEKQINGIKKMAYDYNDTVVNETSMTDELEQYMQLYDETAAKEAKNAKSSAGQADDDGWIVVKPKKSGKRSFIPNSEHADAKIAAKKRKYDKILPNFYNFQKTQSKLDSLTDLKNKFEEDKRKITLMKAARKFKPF